MGTKLEMACPLEGTRDRGAAHVNVDGDKLTPIISGEELSNEFGR
jgi:hypothetical protein